MMDLDDMEDDERMKEDQSNGGGKTEKCITS